MKKARLFFTFVLLLSWVPVLAQRNSTTAPVPFSQAPYHVGERLTYNVSFSSFVSAAHIELFLAGRGGYFNRDGFQVRAHVETTGVVNAALYSLNNDYVCYIDPANGLPYRSQQVVREAGRTADISRELNAAAGTAAVPPQVGSGVFSGTYDVVSALYRLRALPLNGGQKYEISVNSGDTEYNVEIKVTGRQVVKTNVGSFGAIATQLRVLNNSVADKYHVKMYFTEDERHVPILITVQHPSGEIRAELVASEILQVRPAPPIPTPVPQANTGVTIPTPPGRRPAQPGIPPAAKADTSDKPQGALGTDLPFKVGEQLNFNIFLGAAAQPVGTASFQVRSKGQYFNREGLLLSGVAQTNGAGQRIFPVIDQMSSYVDATTILPFRTDMNFQEGKRRSSQTLVLDQDRGNALTEKGTRIDVPVGTHDFISALYALRSFDLSPPRRNAVSLLAHNRPRTLFITSLRRDIIVLGTQSIPAIQLSLTTDDPQSDKYSLRLWVSDDKRRLPLRFTALTQLGPVRSDLAIIPTEEQ